jgi:hypothetical protein
MLHKLLVTFAAFLCIASAPRPTSAPPYLDGPSYWKIHNESGAMELRIDVQFVGNDGISDVYDLTITGTINGQPYSSWAVAYDSTNGQVLNVYNGDSGLFTEWVWKEDHYEKRGGTPSRRAYYPVYD